ncbi:MAG: hypothetical protein RL681_243 [Candidatus Parcubacteria bacterium]|jgi:hypothetical protein
MEMQPQETRDTNRREGFVAFVPQRLSIDGMPELDPFPLNVLFASTTVRDGKAVAASALYKPELHSFRRKGPVSRMLYRNIYGDQACVTISYDARNEKHVGRKFINGECVVITDGGANWQMFFMHLTMSGLVNGEPCTFGPAIGERA